MSDENECIKCTICDGNIIGEITMPEFNWSAAYVCENGHMLLVSGG